MSERKASPWWMLLAGFGMLVAGGLAAWYLYLTHGGAGGDPRLASPAAVTQPAASQPVTVYVTVPATAPGASMAATTAPTSDRPAVGVASPDGASGGGSTRSGGTSTTTSVTVDSSTRGSGNTVVAHNGAIVFVGDHGVLKANTGPTSASGTVAIDPDRSTLSTGNSTTTPAATTSAPTTGTAVPTGTSGTAQPAGTDAPGSPIMFATRADDAAGSGGSRSGSSAPAISARPNGPAIRDVFTEGLADRPVAISGLENHSVNVAGNDQIAVYDDSNLFVNRNGQINANTGDTDSSGLNAVDVTGSRVRSGDSDVRAEDESDQDDEEEDETTGAGDTDTDATPANGAASGGTTTDATPASNGGPAAGATATVVDPDQTASASGRNPLVIGADGYDDLAIRSAGDRNTVVYDDSNVVLGGSGNVNAQIGDSDTGGAVVMGIHDSDVAAGANF